MNKQGQISTFQQISKMHSNIHFTEKLNSLGTGKKKVKIPNKAHFSLFL